MVAIFKKELRSYFVTMTAYVYLGIFVLLMGVFFMLTNISGHNPYFAASLGIMQIMFLVLVPTLTMRLFSEETRQRTDQLLFTSPLKISDVVLGKFAAAAALYAISLLLILVFPYLLSSHTEVDVSALTAVMFGFFLLGASFIVVGLFVSSLTDNQIIAAVATFAAILLFFIMDALVFSMPDGRIFSGLFIGIIILVIAFYIYISAKNIWAALVFCGASGAIAVAARFINPNLYDGVMASVLSWLNLLQRFHSFSVGVLRLSDAVYYLTFIGVFLFLTVHVIERRRWK